MLWRVARTTRRRTQPWCSGPPEPADPDARPEADRRVRSLGAACLVVVGVPPTPNGLSRSRAENERPSPKSFSTRPWVPREGLREGEGPVTGDDRLSRPGAQRGGSPAWRPVGPLRCGDRRRTDGPQPGHQGRALVAAASYGCREVADRATWDTRATGVCRPPSGSTVVAPRGRPREARPSGHHGSGAPVS